MLRAVVFFLMISVGTASAQDCVVIETARACNATRNCTWIEDSGRRFGQCGVRNCKELTRHGNYLCERQLNCTWEDNERPAQCIAFDWRQPTPQDVTTPPPSTPPPRNERPPSVAQSQYPAEGMGTVILKLLVNWVVFLGAAYAVYFFFVRPGRVKAREAAALKAEFMPKTTAMSEAEADMTLRAALAEFQELKEKAEGDLEPDAAKDIMKKQLARAAQYVATVRNGKPDATIHVDGDYPYTYTVDSFSAELLYFEAVLCRKSAPEDYTPLMPFTDPVKFRFNPKLMQQALTAIDKAIAYRKDMSIFHYEKAILLNILGRKREAILSLQKTLELNPKDVDAFRFKNNLINETS